MSPKDERRDGGTASMGDGGPSSKYVAYETDDGDLVIRDEDRSDAWIQSDLVIDLPTEE